MVTTDETVDVSSLRSTMETPQALTVDADNKTVTWERLESLRLHKLGISHRYSRHFNVLRKNKNPLELNRASTIACIALPGDNNKRLKETGTFNKSNSIAPFATVGKATCGYYFTDKTINKKHNFGIPASDLVKWRNFPTPN